VKTASSAKVRKPIYKSAVERWKKYGPGLQPLVDAIAASVPGEAGLATKAPAKSKAPKAEAAPVAKPAAKAKAPAKPKGPAKAKAAAKPKA